MPFTFNAAHYPESPGCYMMKGADGRILYIGKSKSLRNRLRSYFTKQHENKRIKQLVDEIASIEIVLVNNEAESLLLENNLIKRHKPPYNRALMKEESGYAYLQFTKEKLPRLGVYYRNQANRLSKEATGEKLGPFKSSRYRDALLAFVAEHYGLRTCDPMPKRVCLQYHIGKCGGVCEGLVSEADYLHQVREASELLADQGEGLMEALYAKMEQYAEHMQFEKAQRLLLNIRNLEQASDKQIVERQAAIDQDILYFEGTYVLIASVKEGMLNDFRLLSLDGAPGEAAYDDFLMAQYNPQLEGRSRPSELIVNTIGDLAKVRAAINRRGASSIKIAIPKRGIKYELLQLCKSNYDYRIARADQS
ncbi:excinuclease ABC subunit C [Paenibacillus harenae]|nr:GIY-YIG nuclease family protein [Paenibacillus harenae]MDQ0062866.1 excinuclease ABC subunit C [Paenibacillus harenae]